MTFQNVAMEGDVRVDDRALAGMRFHAIEHHSHLLARTFGRYLAGTGARLMVPLHIEDRRQGVWIRRNVEYEPQDLLVCRAAPVDEMIGSARHTGPFCALPVFAKLRIEVVAALGRLYEGETGARGANPMPVDIALPARHVDPLDRLAVRARDAVMEIRVALVRIGIGADRRVAPQRTGDRGIRHARTCG
jgi:hypothetical protein